MDTTLQITPHDGQIPIFVKPDGSPQDARITLAVAGLQGGKTWAGCLWAQLEIQKNPKGIGLVCGTSKDQLEQVVIQKFFELFPSYKQYYVKKEKTVYIPTGGKVFFRSLEDPKYVEGITAHWAWIDEADLCGYKGYSVVRARVTTTRGRLLLTSSIADNSWMSEYLQTVNPARYLITSWESRKNPAFSQEEWDDLKDELEPTLFRRKYEAKLDFSSGLVYGKFDKLSMMLEAVPAADPIEKVFLGFDWGQVDPTAIVAIGLSLKKNIYILDDFSVEGTTDTQIVQVINKFRQLYNVKGYYGDPSNKQYAKSVSTQARIMIQPGVRDIFFGTQIIRNLIHQNRFFVLKRCEHVLWEMRRYRFKEGLIGRSEEPEDKWNHCMDAMRYPLATYPIPSLRSNKKKEVEAVIPPFWLRRTAAYKKEIKRKQPFGTDPSNIFMP